MIKFFKAENLFGEVNCHFDLHPDLNILTGKNGSGKTTLLKLMWYLVSGNIERIIPEMYFDSAELETDLFSITVKMVKKADGEVDRLLFKIVDIKTKEAVELDIAAADDEKLEAANTMIFNYAGKSVFFPTFRRIEGGFALRGRRQLGPRYRRAGSELEDAVTEYSNRISTPGNKFVAAISTSDIEVLLTRRYADISEKTNKLHEQLSEKIGELISESNSRATTPIETLDQISRTVKDITERRKELLRPFMVFSELIGKIFQEKGIQIDVFEFQGAATGSSLASAKGLIASSLLSAGEKQMLSFLCYNAFSNDCPIFIDEPEISLHVDWQRVLFPTLLQQATSNQFVISTHSPFIYSKYPEKELLLDSDRGGE